MKITVQDLINKLKTFDPNHGVIMEIRFDSGCRKVDTPIEDVQFKDNCCVLYGEDR
jgi:hypothetical protein